MGLRINTNLLSLKAQRNLATTIKAFGRSLERLSSGSRINRAGDDAAGLAVSEGLNAQVRGLRVAIRNANDSIGFLNTAEGALNEITNIAQRLRELAVQSANGSISDTDRTYLRTEQNALLDEFNRIARQTDFNGVKLLDGSFTTRDLQVGVSKGQVISFSLGDARTSALGAIASSSGVQHNITSGAAITVNNVAVSSAISTDDTVSYANNSFSAIAVAAAINAQKGGTTVGATVLQNNVDLYDLDFANFDGTFGSNELVINGVSIAGTATTVNDVIARINDLAQSTGVKARINTDPLSAGANDIQLYAEDGRNITISVSATLTQSGGFWDVINATTNMGSLSLMLTASASLSATGVNRTLTGAIRITSASAITFAASSSATVGFSGTSFTVDSTNTIADISISTQRLAADALEIIDVTLDQLYSRRASVGAVQNRLEATSSNLSVMLENIAAARSQLKDTDIAAESAELVRAQILQQAGVTVLSQANASSQVALALLNF